VVDDKFFDKIDSMIYCMIHDNIDDMIYCMMKYLWLMINFVIILMT